MGRADRGLETIQGWRTGYATGPGYDESGYSHPYDGSGYVDGGRDPGHQGARFQAPDRLKPGTRIGAVPSVLYDKMKEIDAAAYTLNSDVLSNIPSSNTSFLASWMTWYAKWKAFYYDRYASGDAARTANLFRLDELEAQINSYDADLKGWYVSYSQQKGASGEPVPRPIGPGAPDPLVHPEPGGGGEKKGSGMPWWGWGLLAVGGSAVIASLWYAFKQARGEVAMFRAEAAKHLFSKPAMLLPTATDLRPLAVPGTAVASAPSPSISTDCACRH